MPYHVLIIEDDSMVAAIDRQYVESDRRFQVDRVFKNGLPALDYLAEHRADLVILDYYTPQMNGQEFLDRLLALPGPAPAVIAVTSANDPDMLEDYCFLLSYNYILCCAGLLTAGSPQSWLLALLLPN